MFAKVSHPWFCRRSQVSSCYGALSRVLHDVWLGPWSSPPPNAGRTPLPAVAAECLQALADVPWRHVAHPLPLETSQCVLSLQLCPALCEPMDCSPPGFSVHGDSPGKNTGMGYAFLWGIILTEGLNPHLLCALTGGLFTTCAT